MFLRNPKATTRKTDRITPRKVWKRFAWIPLKLTNLNLRWEAAELGCYSVRRNVAVTLVITII